jgi:5-carboxymethyl-2-hydroxymuconic-semialdehyde dehydrogenase
MDYIESARARGARILAGGERPESLPDGNFLQATVIADVDDTFEVFREEIFGPVLVAMPFDTEEEAIRLANATQYGLAAYVWTNDIKRAHRVAHAIDTGMCWINSQNVRDLRTPFGGVKNSGIGREGGDYAFEFYCETEIVHVALGTHAIPKLGMGDEEGEDR